MADLRDTIASLDPPPLATHGREDELCAAYEAAFEADWKPADRPAVAEHRADVSEILSRYPEDDPVHRAIERAAPTLLAAVARVDALVAG